MSRLALFALPAAALLLIAAGDPAKEVEHVVEPGETLGGVANRAGVPLVVIAEANGLSEPYVIKVGQTLTIPRQRVHMVKKGETGFGISYRYGLPFKQIAMANGIAEDATLRVGQKLIIPAMIKEPKPLSMAEPVFRRPHDGDVLLGWRRRPDGGGHEGLDFKAQAGDMIRASASGTVIYADDEPDRFGKLVVIDHGNNWHTAYGHLSRVTVTKGESVRAGERVGLAGQSGVATEPELHFEIRKDGKPIDPAPKLGLDRGE